MNGHVICVFRLVIMDRVYNGNDAQTLVWTEMIFVSRLLFKWKRTSVDGALSLLLYFLTKYAHNECLLSVVTASVSKSTRNELLGNITLKFMLFCTFKFLFFFYCVITLFLSVEKLSGSILLISWVYWFVWVWASRVGDTKFKLTTDRIYRML